MLRTFGTICLRKHIFWMSIASDWSLKDRIPIFVLHVKIILYEIHFSATASTSWLPAPPCFLYTAGCSWASFQNLFMLLVMVRMMRMVMVKMMFTNKKDGIEIRQMKPLMYQVPLVQQEWLSLCHSCETARDQHLAVEKQKIHSSQGLHLIDPLLMIDAFRNVVEIWT